MLDRSKKRPRDPNQLARQIFLDSIGESPKFDPAEPVAAAPCTYDSWPKREP
jgi:hypothetical protein